MKTDLYTTVHTGWNFEVSTNGKANFVNVAKWDGKMASSPSGNDSGGGKDEGELSFPININIADLEILQLITGIGRSTYHGLT